MHEQSIHLFFSFKIMLIFILFLDCSIEACVAMQASAHRRTWYQKTYSILLHGVWSDWIVIEVDCFFHFSRFFSDIHRKKWVAMSHAMCYGRFYQRTALLESKFIVTLMANKILIVKTLRGKETNSSWCSQMSIELTIVHGKFH